MTTTPAIPASPAKSGIRSTVLACLVFIVAVVAMFVVSQTREPALSEEQLAELGVMALPQHRRLPAFSLTDHTGAGFTTESLTGQWDVVFFGFTHCPDICPTTMAVLGEATKTAVANGADELPRVLLVSVDPERDTPQKLADYVPWFHPDFLGLTGEHGEITTFATAVNVAFGKVPGKTRPEDYLVDHSGHLVLVDPDGLFHGYIRPPFQKERLAQLHAALPRSS